jgi:hypothetical protein
LKTHYATYHCSSAKKLSLTKIDTSLAFGFYLRDYQDYKKFETFVKEGKMVYQENWIFSVFDEKPDMTPSCRSSAVNNF